MSHAVFQTAQIMPINTQLPTTKLWLPPVVKLGPCQRSRPVLVVKSFTTSSPPSSSSSGVSDGGSVALLERCFVGPCPTPGSDPSISAASSSSFGPVMKGQYGSLGSVTLEKSKLDLSQKQSRSSPEVSCSDLGLFTWINMCFDVLSVSIVDVECCVVR